MTDVNLSVILPSYKEEENLKIILPKISKVLKKLNITYEILVIDTFKSLDNTKEVCIKNNCKYFNRENSNDFGIAVKTGIEKSLGKFIIFMDADGSHEPNFINELYFNIDNNDVVVASRYIKKGGTENTFILLMMSRILNILYSLILNIPCKDISNSYKLYKKEQLDKLKLRCKNFDIIEEILYKLYKQNKNLKIKEIPFIFKKRKFGNTKRNLLLFIISFTITIIKLRLDL